MILALAAVALANEPAEPASRGLEWHLEGSSQLLPDTVALDLRARADGKHDGYILGAMRVDPTGQWIGRAGVGFDVFGGGTVVDLKLGVFLGGVGDLSNHSMIGRPTAGGEVLFGLRFGRVYGFLRHMQGFAGPFEDLLTESELRVGFRFSDHISAHGQLLAINPGTDLWSGGAGLGMEYTF